MDKEVSRRVNSPTFIDKRTRKWFNEKRAAGADTGTLRLPERWHWFASPQHGALIKAQHGAPGSAMADEVITKRPFPEMTFDHTQVEEIHTLGCRYDLTINESVLLWDALGPRRQSPAFVDACEAGPPTRWEKADQDADGDYDKALAAEMPASEDAEAEKVKPARRKRAARRVTARPVAASASEETPPTPGGPMDLPESPLRG